MSGHEHCAASCCSECWEHLRGTKPKPMSVSERINADISRALNKAAKERAVIEAAKKWNDYEGDSEDEYLRLTSALHLAVDALKVAP